MFRFLLCQPPSFLLWPLLRFQRLLPLDFQFRPDLLIHGLYMRELLVLMRHGMASGIVAAIRRVQISIDVVIFGRARKETIALSLRNRSLPPRRLAIGGMVGVVGIVGGASFALNLAITSARAWGWK